MINYKTIFNFGFGALIFFGAWSLELGTYSCAHAQELTYQYQDQIFTIQPQLHWQQEGKAYFFRGKEIIVDENKGIPHGVAKRRKRTWDTEAISQTIESKIANKINRDAGQVTIKRDENGEIVFDGIGFPGRKLDTALTVELTLKALKEDVYTIQLPVKEEDPTMIIADADLKSKGIVELVTV